MRSMSFAFLTDYWPLFLDGTVTTVELAALAVIGGVLMGSLLALMRLSKLKILRIISTAYIELVRGVPLMVQATMIFYGFRIAMGITFDNRFAWSALIMALNSAAYVAEIIRSGIQAVPGGQTEAARSLGLNQTTTMLKIIFPQALRNILPALGNEFVAIIKESSVLYIIGVKDLMTQATTVYGINYRTFECMIVAAIIYFILTFSLSKLLAYFERRMAKSDR